VAPKHSIVKTNVEFCVTWGNPLDSLPEIYVDGTGVAVADTHDLLDSRARCICGLPKSAGAG
jgi:hypothetical protein